MHGFQVADFDSDEVGDAHEIIFDSGLIYYDTYDEANEAGEDYIAAHS